MGAPTLSVTFAMSPPLGPSSPVQSVKGCQRVKGCGGGFDPPMQEVGCVVVVGNVIGLVQAVLH